MALFTKDLNFDFENNKELTIMNELERVIRMKRSEAAMHC